MSPQVVTIRSAESCLDAVVRMLQRGVGRLPVVSRKQPAKVIGYLGREEVMSARLRRIEDEHQREPGWLAASLAINLFTASKK